MSLTSEKVLLGVIEFKEAKRLKSIMEEKGVILELHSNPHTCSTGGCKITLEVFAREEDLPKIREQLEAEKAREMEGLEFNPELMNEVFDPEQETARCPACGESFSTQLNECPGCGLGFGAG